MDAETLKRITLDIATSAPRTNLAAEKYHPNFPWFFEQGYCLFSSAPAEEEISVRAEEIVSRKNIVSILIDGGYDVIIDTTSFGNDGKIINNAVSIWIRKLI